MNVIDLYIVSLTFRNYSIYYSDESKYQCINLIKNRTEFTLRYFAQLRQFINSITREHFVGFAIKDYTLAPPIPHKFNPYQDYGDFAELIIIYHEFLKIIMVDLDLCNL